MACAFGINMNTTFINEGTLREELLQKFSITHGDMNENNIELKINFNDGSKPSLLFLVFSRKANRIIGALAPNTRVKTFARAERSVSVPQTDPELFSGCTAITTGRWMPVKPARRASAIKIYSSPR